jgi:hypothetical protein
MRCSAPLNLRLESGMRSRINPITSAPASSKARVNHDPRMPVQPVTNTRRSFQNGLRDKGDLSVLDCSQKTIFAHRSSRRQRSRGADYSTVLGENDEAVERKQKGDPQPGRM